MALSKDFWTSTLKDRTNPFQQAVKEGNWKVFNQRMTELEEGRLTWNTTTQIHVFDMMIKNKRLKLPFFKRFFEVCPTLFQVYEKSHIFEYALRHPDFHLAQYVMQKELGPDEPKDYVRWLHLSEKPHRWWEMLGGFVKGALHKKMNSPFDEWSEAEKIQEAFPLVQKLISVSLAKSNLPLAKMIVRDFPNQNWQAHLQTISMHRLGDLSVLFFWVEQAQKQTPNLIEQWHTQGFDLFQRWIERGGSQSRSHQTLDWIKQPFVKENLAWVNLDQQNTLMVALKAKRYKVANYLIDAGLTLPIKSEHQSQDEYYQRIFSSLYLSEWLGVQNGKTPPDGFLPPDEWIARSQSAELTRSTPTLRSSKKTRRL